MRSQVIFCLLLLLPALIRGEGGAGLATQVNSRHVYRLEYPADWQVKELAESGFFEASSQLDKASLTNTFRVEIDSVATPTEDFAAFMATGIEELRAELLAETPGLVAEDVVVLATSELKLGRHTAQRIDYSYPLYGALRLRGIRVRVPWLTKIYKLTCNAEEGWYFDQVAADFEAMIASFRVEHPNQAHLDNYIRTRADLDGGERVFYWQGSAYGLIPGERRKDLFDVEGYSIVRAIPDERGYLLLSKEVMLFKHRQSGEILETWYNPMTGRENAVIHVFNDPTNMDLRFTDEYFQWLTQVLPCTELGDQISWHHEFFPHYPNVLSRSDYPLFSQSDTYQAVDISNYLVDRADLEDPLQHSVPAIYTFTRVYPWLPFMRMGERPGNLILTGRGRKLEGGFGDLPPVLREYVLNQAPGFARAPDAYSQPNSTIWSNFKKMAEEGLIDLRGQ